jgi:hypothetical protein
MSNTDMVEKDTNKSILRYYCFDWDDNILTMPTMIHLEKKVKGEWQKMDVTTEEFTHVRKSLYDYYELGDKNANWRYNNNSNIESFSEFRDFGPRGKNAFLEDAKKSIRYKKFGPVWKEFINCLVGGNKFLIITARGHEPKTIKRTVKWIVYRILNRNQRNEMVENLKQWNKMFNVDCNGWVDKDYINYYLDFNSYIGIKSDWFNDNFGIEGKVASPEKYKAVAIKNFVEKIYGFGKTLGVNVKVGFSDDDLATVESIKEYFKNELSLDFPMEYHSYHTKNDGTKTKLD